MVMNKVLEHRNFMHPMVRRLSMHSKCLDFFSFKFFLVGGGFCSFFICSQHVPFKFPICSIGSQCVLQGCAQQDLALIPYVLPKVLPFSPTQLGQRGDASSFPQNLEYWEASKFQFSFAMGQSKWIDEPHDFKRQKHNLEYKLHATNAVQPKRAMWGGGGGPV